jgi:hypothetical protein
MVSRRWVEVDVMVGYRINSEFASDSAMEESIVIPKL